MRRLVIIDQDGNSIKNDIFEKIFDIRESEIERKLEVRESFIKENNLKYFVMGNGSNLLISSKVFDGVVIKLNKLNNVQIYDNEVYVEAGYPLIKLCMLCADNNLGNLEFASGIPACVGGAICSNACLLYTSDAADD